MNKVKEFFRDLADNNPLIVVLIGISLLCVGAHLFTEYTALGNAIHEFNLNPNLK